MRLPSDLVEAVFLERLNRFAGRAQVGQRRMLVHIANSGRLQELLQRGNRCYLAPQGGAGRKTRYDLCLVEVGHTLVSLVAEALAGGLLPPFRGYNHLQREAPWREGGLRARLDLLLSGPRGRCVMEVKSVTLVEEGVGLFPDAPTERGRRHLSALMEAARLGYRAALLFVIQREDAQAFAPNGRADPGFARLLHQAPEAGVEAYAFTCRLSLKEIRLNGQVPVVWSP